MSLGEERKNILERGHSKGKGTVIARRTREMVRVSGKTEREEVLMGGLGVQGQLE